MRESLQPWVATYSARSLTLTLTANVWVRRLERLSFGPRQKASELGLAKSSFYPQLEGLAIFGDERIITPYPTRIAPRGYVMVEVPIAEPELTLQYLIFDLGKRAATVARKNSQPVCRSSRPIKTWRCEFRRPRAAM